MNSCFWKVSVLKISASFLKKGNKSFFRQFISMAGRFNLLNAVKMFVSRSGILPERTRNFLELWNVDKRHVYLQIVSSHRKRPCSGKPQNDTGKNSVAEIF